MLQTKKLRSKSWKTRVFFTFRLPILDGRVHEQVSSVLFFTVFFEGERHDLSKTGGFGRKMPPPPGKPVTFYECHPDDHAPAPSVRADLYLIYIAFISHRLPIHPIESDELLLLIPIESEGDRRSPTAEVDLWEPVSRDEFVHLLRDFKLGEEGPRDQSGHWDWRKQQGKNGNNIWGQSQKHSGISYDCQITRCCLLVSPSYVDWFMFTHLTIASSSP